jgi:hypothetical protein
MATRSTLRISTPNKTSKVSYCHWDGFPSNMLPILNGNYNTIEKANELIALGNLSSLGKRVKPEPGENHSFNSPISDVTVAYHRDRGEKLEWYDKNNREKYNYEFDGTSWLLI